MSQKYCKQIQAVVKPYWDLMMLHIKAIDFTPYGLQKSGASHAL